MDFIQILYFTVRREHNVTELYLCRTSFDTRGKSRAHKRHNADGVNAIIENPHRPNCTFTLEQWNTGPTPTTNYTNNVKDDNIERNNNIHTAIKSSHQPTHKQCLQ
jgi:hypothetical protein